MILYIDTSDSSKTTVAIQKDDVRKSITEKTNREKSQNVLPLIERLLKKNTYTLANITHIKIARGPGSFTGLRVGMAVANALAWVLNIPVNEKAPPEIPIYTPSPFDISKDA